MKKKLIISCVVFVLLLGSFSTNIYAGTGDIITYIAEKILGEGDNDNPEYYHTEKRDCTIYKYNPKTGNYDMPYHGTKTICVKDEYGGLSECKSNGKCV